MGIVNASIPFTGKMNGYVFRKVGDKLLSQTTVDEINAETEQYGMGLRVVDGHLALDMATDEALDRAITASLNKENRKRSKRSSD